MKYLNLLLLLFVQILFAQNITNTLKGKYIAKSNDILYSSFDFLGNGIVEINEMHNAEFFERNDSVVILVDNTFFAFKKNKNNLKGISSWVENNVYKASKSENSSTNNDSIQQRAIWISKHYDINYKNMFDVFGASEEEYKVNSQNIIAKNNALCDDGFDLGCIQVFSLTLMNLSGGIEGILSNKPQPVFQKNEQLEKLAQRVIDLGNYEGYGLFGSYYAMLGDTELAESFFEKGAEGNCETCMSYELNKILKEIEKEIAEEDVPNE